MTEPESLTSATTSAINLTREITVVCGGPGASTNFIIDVVGFYR